MTVEISDADLIKQGVEPLIASVYGMVDRLFPDNDKVRRAALELFAHTALERMTHAQRLELIGAIETRWKRGVQ